MNTITKNKINQLKKIPQPLAIFGVLGIMGIIKLKYNDEE